MPEVPVFQEKLEVQITCESFHFFFEHRQLFTFILKHADFEEVATRSSILAGKIPWIEEPGGLQSTGSQRVRQD